MDHLHNGSNTLVSVLFPFVKDLNLISLTVSVGLLFAIAFFVEEKKGYLRDESQRLKKLLQLSLMVWIVTTVGSIFIQLANILDENLLSAFDSQILRSFLQQTVIGRVYVFQLLFALSAALLINKAKKVGAIYWALGLTLLSAILPIFQSHASGLSNHSLAIGSLVFHLIFVTIWVGGVIGLLVVSPITRSISLKRFSAVALWCAVIVSISGAVNAYAHLNFAAAWRSPYSAFVIAKIVFTGLLIAIGAKHRRYIIAKKPQQTFSLLGVEVIVMVLTIAVGGWLSTLSPPEHPGTPNVLSAPNLTRLFWYYTPDALFLGILILASALYLRGVFLLRRRGDKWPIGRTLSFFAGIGFADYATSGGIGIYATYAFSYHMIAHMVIGMIAPIGFVLSAPITLALRTLPIGRTANERGIRGSVISLIHAKIMGFYTNPVVVLAIFDGSLFLLYMTPLFGALMHSHSGHFIMNLHFLLAGYLFFHVIIGVDPNPRKVAHIVRIIILFAAMSIHAFFSIALLSTTSLVDGGYFASLHRTWNTDLLLDQHLGGSIGWAMGEIPILLALIATFIQWVRDDSREAKRIDRAAERADAMGEDDELAQYNKYLSSLQKRDE
jgi:putative copper resistance protein D